MQPTYILFTKNYSETSLQALERARIKYAIPVNIPMTYAGTLDPMAEGLLLLLVGEECKNKEKYTKLNKEYEVEILIGVSTDTDDILGLIKDNDSKSPSHDDIESVLQSFVGKRLEQYHPFSHKKIDGTPLFEHAKAGIISEIEIPEKEIEIYSIDVLGWKKYSIDELEKLILSRLEKVQGDFRQTEIIQGWEDLLEQLKQEMFESLTIRVSCSSGTYMRNLVRNLAEKIGVPAVALRITRTKITGL